jgi:hypothetical protein
MGAYLYVVSLLLAEVSCAVGSDSRQVGVDGVASDWRFSVPLASFQARKSSPSELEFSALCVASDAENLYVRIDTGGVVEH